MTHVLNEPSNLKPARALPTQVLPFPGRRSKHDDDMKANQLAPLPSISDPACAQAGWVRREGRWWRIPWGHSGCATGVARSPPRSAASGSSSKLRPHSPGAAGGRDICGAWKIGLMAPGWWNLGGCSFCKQSVALLEMPRKTENLQMIKKTT